MKWIEIIEWTEDVFKFKLSDGEKSSVCYDCLKIYETEYGKLYILYTDNSLDENGNTRVFAGILHEDVMVMEDIVSELELKLINILIKNLHNLTAGGVEFDSLKDD